MVLALAGIAACQVRAATLFVVDPADMVDSRAASSVAIAVEGYPRLAYANAATGALRFARCFTFDCSTLTLATFDAAIGFDSSMAIGADGNPVVAYYDFVLDTLRLAACQNVDCSGVEDLRTIDDPSGDVGQYASMVIDPSGRPVIAYFDNSSDSLRPAACLEADGANVSIMTVHDAAGRSIGEFVDLALGADGFPVMAYADLPTGILTVAKCLDATCSASPTIHAVEGAPGGASVGRYTSIAIGTDGNPIISYQDFGNQALKVAKCVDNACAAPATISTLDTRDEDAGAYTGDCRSSRWPADHQLSARTRRCPEQLRARSR